MNRLLVGLTFTGILSGAVAWGLGHPFAADMLWAATTAVMLVPLTLSVVRDLRRGKPGVDIIALLAMAAALVVGQYAAGAIIALMLSGGLALEAFADARARRELDALLARIVPALYRLGYESTSVRFLGSSRIPKLLAAHGFVVRPQTRMVALALSTTSDSPQLRDTESWYLTDLDEDT